MAACSTVLVTGAAGFVGAAVARALAADGHRIRALVRASSPRANLLGLDAELVTADLMDAAAVAAACIGADAVIHVAADYRLWARDPEEIVRNNVAQTTNVMRGALAAGVGRVVYTSSVATLGLDRTPADETDPLTPDRAIGAYKRSKVVAERLVEAIIRDDGLPAVIVNPSTPIGPRDVRPTPTGRIIALDDRLALRSLIAAGYVVATADIRGKGASFGHRRGFQDRREARDGYDLIEWLARQPYSTGKVGMIGCSYLGGTTFQTLSTLPPSLKAAFIGASDFDKYASSAAAAFPHSSTPAPTSRLRSISPRSRSTPTRRARICAPRLPGTRSTRRCPAVVWHAVPRQRLLPHRQSVLGGGRALSLFRAIRHAGIPTYFWGNWQDEPTAQVIEGAANVGGKFLAGPGSHCVPPPGFDFTGEIRRYFDHYLKRQRQRHRPYAAGDMVARAR